MWNFKAEFRLNIKSVFSLKDKSSPVHVTTRYFNLVINYLETNYKSELFPKIIYKFRERGYNEAVITCTQSHAYYLNNSRCLIKKIFKKLVLYQIYSLYRMIFLRQMRPLLSTLQVWQWWEWPHRQEQSQVSRSLVMLYMLLSQRMTTPEVL